MRNDAKTRGERLFVERTGPFVNRIHAYWTTAAVGADQPVAPPVQQQPAQPEPLQQEPVQQDNVVAIGNARTGRAGQS